MQNSTQAKSVVGSMRASAHNFYATMVRGEVSDANVRGYLRAASQIEDIWQQIDDKIAAAIASGTSPWDAYSQLHYPLVFIRSARACQVFVEQLLAADAAFDPKTAGYLPHVTYDQADALCHQIEPALERAVASLNDPNFVPDIPLPLILGPRIESEGQPCPVPHLEGMIAAAREVREWAAGLIAQYSNAISQAKVEVPQTVTNHITALQGQLTQGDSQLRYGSDLVGQVTQYGSTPQLHEDAENSLWAALQKFFLVNQAVAMPELLRGPVSAPGVLQGAQRPRRTGYRDMRILPIDLWRVAAPSARSEIRGTEFGTDEMNEMCEKMGGILSAGAQQYLDESEAAVANGDAYIIAAMANCPFEPLYKARRPLEIAGANIPASYEFHWDFHRGHIETAPRFGRVDNWQECEE